MINNYFRLQGKDVGCQVWPFDDTDAASRHKAMHDAQQARDAWARMNSERRVTIVLWRVPTSGQTWGGLGLIGAGLGT
jgi:hypothetical protein